MIRIKPLAIIAALAFCGAVNGVAARQLPIASQDESDALAFAERVDLRSCIWAEGQLLCMPYAETQADAGHDAGYYAPGIYVGFQNPRAVLSPRDALAPRKD